MTVAQLEQHLGEIWARGSVGEIILDEVERQIAGALRLDAVALTELMDDVWREYVGTLNEELAEYFRAAASWLQDRHLEQQFVGARERERESHRLGDLCDVIVYSHEEGCLKPDPQIYRIACERLAVAPERTVLLDDLIANVEGARAIGMTRSFLGTTSRRSLSSRRSLTSDAPTRRVDDGPAGRADFSYVAAERLAAGDQSPGIWEKRQSRVAARAPAATRVEVRTRRARRAVSSRAGRNA